jgi:hypothetical protein
MANLRLARRSAVIDLSLHHAATSNATAQRHVKHRVAAHASAAPRFGQCRDVGIVIDSHRQLRHSCEPSSQIEIRPAFDLMRSRDATGAPIDGAAEADADGRGIPFRGQGQEPGLHLVANAGSAFGAIHVEAHALDDATCLIARNDLQLRPPISMPRQVCCMTSSERIKSGVPPQFQISNS